MDDKTVRDFMSLFRGLNIAFGTGAGRWIHRPPTEYDFKQHLQGVGEGIGIAPLMQDSTVLFATIDLDEPDFEAALAMQDALPGTSWIERSRSGNAHVHVFFREPIEAWVPMGILKEATFAAGKDRVEIFPKNHDFSKVKYGNYINLPYYGEGWNGRPILYQPEPGVVWPIPSDSKELYDFVRQATESLNDPDEWRRRADWLQITSPSERTNATEFGTMPYLHMCAEWIIDHCESNPVTPGHRSIVYFNLAKMILNCEMYDEREAYELLEKVNDASTDPIPAFELRRILGNAARGRYTSFGCDDPLMQPYIHPECQIAHPGSN